MFQKKHSAKSSIPSVKGTTVVRKQTHAHHNQHLLAVVCFPKQKVSSSKGDAAQQMPIFFK
jgi:hypothetical protein